ncbi:AraC family transcriptional regulator ['Paenibacillus yunnanensis' Narsing Rao et al. 2020]|uniref:AraC family transcriptional regulator n=1 Tax=Paenibacillus tengchongensis TaxID=2608684 RepID=UPI00124C2753|nr:AraC family transcriptional regulator [Paenibacillus tengchongensis]
MIESAGNGVSLTDAPYYSLKEVEALSCPPGERIQLAGSAGFTLLIPMEGQGWAQTEQERCALDRGNGWLFEPGMRYRIQGGTVGLVLYRLEFTAVRSDFMQSGDWPDIAPQEELLRPGPVCCRPVSQCLLMLEEVVQNRQGREPVERFAGQVRFQELLLLLMRANPTAVPVIDERKAVQHSILYMQEHYPETISVELLAEVAGIGRTRYSQLFKEVTGQNPLEFLNRMRIERAQQQLLLTGDRLHEIALSVGYSNEYYFNRRFKGMVGVTPGQYRSIHQTGTRVFAPFLEDYLLALGIIPVAQYCHPDWGKQDYLQLRQVPTIDISSGDWQELARYSPELIMLDDGFRRWHLEECSTVAPLFKLPHYQEDWRATLRSAAAVFGRPERVREVIAEYEHEARLAKGQLSRSVRQQTVAFLRISAGGIALYGCERLGYTAPVLHQDLGLTPHPLVRRLTSGQKRVALSAEELSQLHADHLFITFDRLEGEGRELLETELWQALPAVRSGTVYEVDFMAWMNYGVLAHRRKISDVLQVLA